MDKIILKIGIFDIKKQDQDWKVLGKYKTAKEGYAAFKDLCKKCVGYTYEELLDIYDSARLDIELVEAVDEKKETILKWMVIYEKEIEEEEE